MSEKTCQMFMNDVLIFKKRLMNDICSDASIIKLLDIGIKNQKPETAEESDLEYYPNKQVFPYHYIDETIENARPILCFELETVGLTLNNDIIKDMDMTIYVLVPQKYMNVRQQDFEGARTDLLIHELDKLLNRNPDYGFRAMLDRTEVMPNPPKAYYGMILTYTMKSVNSDNEHAKQNYKNKNQGR